MGERLPEHKPVNPEVYIGGDGTPLPTLLGQMLALYPERCLRGGGVNFSFVRVCSTIGSFLGEMLDNVEEGTMTPDDAIACAITDAAIIKETCPNGPPNSVVGSSLKCGVDARNYFETRDRLEGYA